jgi:hypothetical protein
MKKLFSIFLIIFSVVACNQDTKETDYTATNEAVKVLKPAEIADVPWMAVVDSISQEIKMIPSNLVKTEELSSDNVSKALNLKYPESKIIFQKQLNDTAFVNIPNATYLTQSNGSMGAKIFMAEVVYSFTQIPGTQYVNFSFKEGDHASPGTFSRIDFPFTK